MVTYEDVTQMFLRAAEAVGLATHPEHWINNQTLEREFACTCHPGTCDEAENRSTVTASFNWSPLDTVLSQEGAVGICDFFHEPDEACPHLHTDQVPPLVVELSYNLNITAVPLSDINLQQVIRLLKLRASEHSRHTSETRASVSLTLGDGEMQAEALTLQQQVEIPLWHPDGLAGLQELRELDEQRGSGSSGRRRRQHDEEGMLVELHPEEWLPQLLAQVARDMSHVLTALEAMRPLSRPSDPADAPSDN